MFQKDDRVKAKIDPITVFVVRSITSDTEFTLGHLGEDVDIPISFKQADFEVVE